MTDERKHLERGIVVLIATLVVVGFAGIVAAEGLGKYRDVDRAEADGYVEDPFGCVPNMGLHYGDFSRIDGDVTVGHPEMLVYAHDDGDLRFLGVEYIATEEFSLFGHHAHPIPGTDWYGLHVWFFELNDDGRYADLHADVDADCTFEG